MPQMAPMWWTTLMMLTMFMMFITLSINYFSYNKTMKFNSKNNNNPMNWKWY
uniref:ATP synthase F0 subunit 8 n=1 Tax=Orosius sp. TaxID=2974349 RepID=UPI002181F6A5|nr:ATP synthase F0 subunit 8 [Orosius sp.]UVI59890.1 ATP synthase F0 subunit 8 [Orosius sp.]